MDEALFATINGLAGHHAVIDDICVLASSAGPYLLIGALVLLWCWPGDRSRRDRRQGDVMIALLSMAAALSLNQLIIYFWNRPRPFARYAATLLLPPSQDPSFPSDHASFGFAIAMALILSSRRIGLPVLLFAALLGFSRVYTGEHYGSDVVVGALIGGTMACMFHLAKPYLTSALAPLWRWARRWHLA
jgi:undecaprenyl-diphosphatase